MDSSLKEVLMRPARRIHRFAFGASSERETMNPFFAFILRNSRRRRLQYLVMHQAQAGAPQPVIAGVDGHFVIALIGQFAAQVGFCFKDSITRLGILIHIGGHFTRSPTVARHQMRRASIIEHREAVTKIVDFSGNGFSACWQGAVQAKGARLTGTAAT